MWKSITQVTNLFITVQTFVLKYVFLFFVFLLLFSTPVSAASTFTINNAPASILENQEFQVLVNLTVGGSAGKTYYLRADFYKADTTSYFGYTKNNENEWYNPKQDFDYTKLYKIQMLQNNTWSGVLEIKPDSGASGFKGSGNYYLKVRRYIPPTDPTKPPNYEWSDPVQITVTGDSTVSSPSPSATPTPSPSPSPSPTPSPSSGSTPTPSPSPSPKVSPSPKPSPKLSPSPTVTPKKSPSPSPQEKEMVLGIQESSPEATLANVVLEASPEGESKTLFAGYLNKNTLLPAGLIGIGLVLLVFSIYSLFRKSSSVRITGEDKQSLFSSERENEKF